MTWERILKTNIEKILNIIIDESKKESPYFCSRGITKRCIKAGVTLPFSAINSIVFSIINSEMFKIKTTHDGKTYYLFDYHGFYPTTEDKSPLYSLTNVDWKMVKTNDCRFKRGNFLPKEAKELDITLEL